MASIIIPDKTDFKAKATTRNKEGSSNFTSWYSSRENQDTKLKRHIHPYVHGSIIYNRWMDKEVVPTYNAIGPGHKKEMKACHLQQQGWS